MTVGAEDAEDGYILKLDRGLGVRRYRLSDAESMAHHANNKNVAKFMRDRFPSPYTLEAGNFWIELCNSQKSMLQAGEWSSETGASGPLTALNYAITVNDETVGSIGLEPGHDVYIRSAELGYWIGEEHWGKGVMSTIVPAFVQWTWKTFGILVRLNGEVGELNKGSAALLGKAGFVVEGRRENAVFKNGKLESVIMFGALRPT
ncbi:hypothetical protein CLAFUW4_01469 [Fulvia fulva]|uniref:N-acetyltransferase domain-containing protein n=1 Tax=Passalora fulva TaxID=5499 RepID=A0A9Q8L7A2_PASFU|nr:uncharacterized protein CLAFUR5_01471 [Fulvia fulva]KAK4635170.1 hypothetical protein CLAFUR4_01470 [Fulvia fulva]KAK4637316.1 hypothetical protein CLAFUR0_01471 [Fulvia fulva]UJO12039.1 hypothetical protein CLAFUR5_01471 [Fulvia fulva]WPV09307.1 hypothetical protein CLAFUW4_01469 [Fulvia fulva]WPV25161.1 hypothetical protein CLAFUW7_01474 [Fulvia fulva]